MPHFDLKTEGAVQVLTMTNGANANTLTEAILGELTALLTEVEAKEGNTALLIHSDSAKYWSTGLNTDWLMQQPREFFPGFMQQLDQFLLKLALLKLPTVGCLTGHTFGGGALMAAALDFRVMNAEKGWFCFPEVDVKIPFSHVMHRLVEDLVTPQVMREMTFTGARYGGEEALQKGVVDRIAPATELFQAALQHADFLAQKDRKTYTAIKLGVKDRLLKLYHA